jgi:O-antigen/teichoic acid export membrane protein
MQADPSLRKFNRDLIWNAGSFGMTAVFGVLLNVAIIRWYGTEALGVFNLVYAVYILLSQMAVGGVHLAVQAFVPRELHKGRSPDAHVTAAMLLAMASSLLVMALAWAGRELPGRWFTSPAVGQAFPLVIWGLLFFSWNKILLSFHNGARRMRLFAVFQFLRAFLMILGMVLMIVLGARMEQLPQLLAWTELGLFAMLLPVSLVTWKPWKKEGLSEAFGESFRFGNRVLTGNFLLDINTRVDVFILGVLLNERAVGLYSFASTVAEGVLQLPVLFRNNINPVLARAWAQGGPALLAKVMVRARKGMFKILAPVMGATILLFPAVLWIFGMQADALSIWAVYALLVGGAVAVAGRLPFYMLFSQLGHPGHQTLFVFGGFLMNVALNLVLVPVAGITGAGLATGLATVFAMLLHRRMSLGVLGIRF